MARCRHISAGFDDAARGDVSRSTAGLCVQIILSGVDRNHAADNGVHAVHPQDRVYPIVPGAATLGADVAEITGMAPAISRFRTAVRCAGWIEVPAVAAARTSFVDVPLMDVEGEAAIIQTPHECYDTNAVAQSREIYRSLDAAASRRLEFGACSLCIGRERRGHRIRRQ